MIIRKVTFDDWEVLLAWRNELETRKNSHNREFVREESHKAWLRSALANENRQLYVGCIDGSLVGTVRADFSEVTNDYELSWTVAPDFRGKGIGKMMVKILVEKLNSRVRAEIKSGNTGSVKIAESVGMKFKKEENNVLHYANY